MRTIEVDVNIERCTDSLRVDYIHYGTNNLKLKEEYRFKSYDEFYSRRPYVEDEVRRKFLLKIAEYGIDVSNTMVVFNYPH